jgi:hypothetical protein
MRRFLLIGLAITYDFFRTFQICRPVVLSLV